MSCMGRPPRPRKGQGWCREEGGTGLAWGQDREARGQGPGSMEEGTVKGTAEKQNTLQGRGPAEPYRGEKEQHVYVRVLRTRREKTWLCQQDGAGEKGLACVGAARPQDRETQGDGPVWGLRGQPQGLPKSTCPSLPYPLRPRPTHTGEQATENSAVAQAVWGSTARPGCRPSPPSPTCPTGKYLHP